MTGVPSTARSGSSHSPKRIPLARTASAISIILPAKAEAAEGETQAVLSEAESAAAEVPAGTAGIPAESTAPAEKIPAASYSAESMAEAFEDVPEDKSAATLNMSDDEIPDVSDALVAALATTQVNRSDYYQQVRQPVEEIPEEYYLV